MSRPATILLVDDDADFVEMNRAVLEGAGYTFVAAANTQEALAALAAQPIHLVITDLMMGELNSGFSLAEHIRRAGRVPVIMTTSVTRTTGMDFTPRSPAELARMNIDAYFEKPVKPQALLEAVARLLLAGPHES